MRPKEEFGYDLAQVMPTDLNSTHVLVGECGGLSAILARATGSALAPKHHVVLTEHGHLYLPSEVPVDVLDLEQPQIQTI